MAPDKVTGYRLPEEFKEDAMEPLVDLAHSDSSELWLIQWPIHQNPEIDGKELSIELRAEGRLGNFKDSNGKGYDLVSCAAKEQDATVFVSTASDAKIVGKISRRVALVHYPSPEEYEKRSSDNKRLKYAKPTSTLMTNSTPKQSSRQKSSISGMARTVSTHGSGQKSSITMDPSTISRSSEHSKKRKSRK